MPASRPNEPNRYARPSSLRRRFVTTLAAIFASLATPTAYAQGFELNRFRPAPLAQDGLAVDGTDTPGHLSLLAAVTFDGSLRPIEVTPSSGERYAVISEQLAVHGHVALGLGERFALFAAVPVNLLIDGEDPAGGGPALLPRPEKRSLGDTLLGGRVQLWDDAVSPFTLALQALVYLPTSKADSNQRYSGSGSVGLEPQLLAEIEHGDFKVRGNVGVRLRDSVELLGIQLGHELTWGGGVEYAFLDKSLRLMIDVFGGSYLDEFAREVASPVEILFGGKYQHDSGFYAAFGAGPGLNAGVGAPMARGVVSLGYASPAQRDRDADGIWDREDACPEAAEDRDGVQDEDGCPDLDNDSDGVLDTHDQCPNEAEDLDGFDDADGCPDPDNDGDGVPDVQDACPQQAEDADGFEDTDGCPEPDNDRDGVPDSHDSCPTQAEDADAYQDEDGCPDPDNDADGIVDPDDRCPNDAGVAEEQGCPRTRIEAGRITIADRIEFALNSDVLLPQSNRQLDEVSELLKSNPQVTKLRLEGHTDSNGQDAANMQLSKRRAASVRSALIARGVAPERLEAWGCGEALPIADNEDEEGRQTNRRVEFHVLSPAPEAGPRSPEGCEQQP